jgi:type I restriction enzyme S subunit
MRLNYKPIGDYVNLVEERNKDLQDLPLIGLSITKQFIPSIANTIGTDMSTYRTIYKNQFAYSAVTSRNGDKLTIALFKDLERGLISQAYTPFEVTDTKELLPEYLMMWFSRPEFDRYARFKSHGSARELFSWEDLCESLMPVPTITKQKEIVAEYNIIQNRIDLNKQLIQKLEETAQAIYKNWFVDFEFPDENGLPYKSNGGEMVESELGEIPKGWEVGKLPDLIEVKYGKAYAHLVKGSIPLYGSGGIMGYVDNKLYNKPSILIPRKGTLNNIMFINHPFWCVDTMFFSKILVEHSGYYVFYYLKQFDFGSLDVGSAVPSMTTSYLNGMKIIKPSKNTLKVFDTHFDKIIKLIEERDIQNKTLEELQSLLLSKLATIEN